MERPSIPYMIIQIHGLDMLTLKVQVLNKFSQKLSIFFIILDESKKRIHT